jgi:hypothetical protein
MIREVAKINDNELEIILENGDKHLLNFKSKVNNVLKVQDGVIVLLKTTEEIRDQNIKKFDENGHYVWTVGKPSGSPGFKWCAFTYLGFDDAGNLLGGCLNDYTYKIDINTGQLLDREYRR